MYLPFLRSYIVLQEGGISIFFFYFSLGIFIVFFLFTLLTNKYVNPYKLIMIFGKKGSGKSTTLAKAAVKHIKKGWTVYSTERIPGTYYIDYSDIGQINMRDFNYVEFDPAQYRGLIRFLKVLHNHFFPRRPKVLLLVDEVGMIWHSRDFKSFPKYLRNWFKLQRHYYTKVIMFSQSFDIDKSLRDLTDQMFLVKNVFRVFTYGKRIKKFITINNNSEDGGKLDESFEFDSFLFWFLGSRTLTYIPRYAKLFNTYDAPQLQDIDFVQTPYRDKTDFPAENPLDLADEREEG